VHTRLMRGRLDVVCSGPTRDDPDSPYQWKCRACGLVGTLDASTFHMIAPPNYFGDLKAALWLFDDIGQLVGTRIELWRGAKGYHAIVCDYPGLHADTLYNSPESWATALMSAALLACGIIDADDVVLDELPTIEESKNG